ncbi:hypothetical protein [Jannaschia formosa]|uniref:hypothetical protein n=1 Tax=Jannaschia formosa TaxID=2259592 RepID=UPI000E1BAF99|nr:hypothetical protein [Jannaschia formosa]TFL17752.1 hypothetical protein DR046_12675 [Jannaschia formosa]
MPHPNRVQPDGSLATVPERGTMMGNRGVLHDEAGEIGPKRWAHRNWVCCTLVPRGKPRKILRPGRYTELFFLDEAVALAAGHRPCAECRRADYERWRGAWAEAFGTREGASAMDARLHAARAIPGARRLRHETGTAADLPDGSFFAQAGRAFLLTGGRALPYAPDGYGSAEALATGPVTILTNPVARAVLAGGYRPALHPSAVRRSSPPS